MKILVACEESQRVCTAFRGKGHEAYSCDIEPCSGGHPEWHIKQDVLPLLGGRCNFMTCDDQKHSIEYKWDMIIAFPPCTYLSNAGACRLYPRKGVLDEERYKMGIKAKAFFLQILDADCDMIAIENPVHSLIFQMPRHAQEIQPWQFGHPVSKKNKALAQELAAAYTCGNCGVQGYISSERHRPQKPKYIRKLQAR